MWQWFLAGALVLTNVATILIVVAVVRMHLRRAGLELREGADAQAGPGADLDGAREDTAELIRQVGLLAADFDARVTRRAEGLRKLLAEVDASIAELHRLSAASPPPPGQAAHEADSRRGEILRLARQRIEPVEIARRMEMDVGEVELVLNLYGSARLRPA